MYKDLEDVHNSYKLWKPTIYIGHTAYELQKVDHYGKSEYHIYKHKQDDWCLKIRVVKGQVFETIFSKYSLTN